jgi:prepilin-type N-terminal cleavage/methylation domain-containing protein
MRFHPDGRPIRGDLSNSAGFSLLETLVSMVIFSIVSLSVLGLLEVARKGRTSTMQRSENLQNARVALRQMSVDVLNAGVNYQNAGPLLPTNWLNTHLGLPASNPAGTTLDQLTPVVPGPGSILGFGALVPNSKLTNTTGTTPVVTTTDQVTLVSVNHAFDGGNAVTIDCNVCTPAAAAAGEVVSAAAKTATLQITSPVNNLGGGASVCNVGDIYYVYWANASVIGIVTSLATVSTANDSVVLAASTDPLGLNSFVAGSWNIGAIATPKNTTTGAAANPFPTGMYPVTPLVAYAYKLTLVTYYVLDDGSGLGTGTLMRRLYGGVSGAAAIAYTDQPLAYGVTNMTLSYFLTNETSTNFGTGSPQNPVGATSVVANANFMNIRQIQATITVQSPTKDPSTNKPYLETLTSVMNCRNLGYETNN